MFRKLGILEVEESTSRTQRRPDYGFFESDDRSDGVSQRLARVGLLNETVDHIDVPTNDSYGSSQPIEITT